MILLNYVIGKILLLGVLVRSGRGSGYLLETLPVLAWKHITFNVIYQQNSFTAYDSINTCIFR